MQNILFINYDDILHYTHVGGNIDINKINPHIYNAQILFIEPILNSSLYEKVRNLIDTGNIDLEENSNYDVLLTNYITPSLSMHSMELFLPLNAFEAADGGMFRMMPTNASYSPLDEIEKIVKKYKAMAGKYDDLLQKYLCENSDLYPEYTNNVGLVDKIKTTNSRAGGLYIG